MYYIAFTYLFPHVRVHGRLRCHMCAGSAGAVVTVINWGDTASTTGVATMRVDMEAAGFSGHLRPARVEDAQASTALTTT